MSLDNPDGRLWTILTTVLAAILGWLGYQVKSNVDLKKERRIHEMNKCRELDDKLDQIPKLIKINDQLIDSQSVVISKLDKLIKSDANQEKRLSKLSAGVQLSLGAHLDEIRILEDSGLGTSKLDDTTCELEKYRAELITAALSKDEYDET